LVFDDCRIFGTAVHGYGSKDHPNLATQYLRCRFEDREYQGKVYRSAALVEGGGDNVSFDGCTFIGHKNRSLYLDDALTREIVRNCSITHQFDAPGGDFQALLRGCILENVHFMEDFPKDTAKKWYIEAQNVAVKGGVAVDGPRCRWRNPRVGPIGAIPPDNADAK
jgi:hypothetical protein